MGRPSEYGRDRQSIVRISAEKKHWRRDAVTDD